MADSGADAAEPLEYTTAHVSELLATDPRVSEQGLRITVRGDRLFVTGTVPTLERQAAIDDVLGELETGYEIHNETTVARLTEPDESETLP